jgi:hypothetical protein
MEQSEMGLRLSVLFAPCSDRDCTKFGFTLRFWWLPFGALVLMGKQLDKSI